MRIEDAKSETGPAPKGDGAESANRVQNLQVSEDSGVEQHSLPTGNASC